MADEDLFNLDDFQEPEVSDNSINISSSKQEPEPENKIQEQKEIKEEPKDISTKANSDKQEIIKVEQPNQNIEISKFTEKSKENEIKSEQKENSLNESDNNEPENENDESSNESQENDENIEEETQINLDFKERHDKMQSWAIEDDLDISAFSQIKDPPIKFPFELDEFQKRSILRLENHQNVLVCAHTSSGKTVVAEYGIALGKRNSKRVLYTSPIKALSNQKFREFKKKFNDVGILTGDVSINPEAQCLIMTTEILQSSLYKNSELLNQVEWVIFDEVHYINDNERGHVWEEILILLPKGIGIIMLSATVPNYMEFAQWVGDIKETKVYVQNTLKRVVPLQHLLFIDYNNVFLVKQKDKIYKDKLDQAFHELKNQMNRYGRNKKSIEQRKIEKQYIDNIKYFDYYKLKDKKNKGKQKSYYQDYDNQNKQIKITKVHHKIDEIINYLNDQDLCPAVIFVFSIKRITEYAKMLSLKSLISNEEKKQITEFYEKVVNSMPIEDQNIPQVQELSEILISGIGVHHAGLLPIIKETIEILYSRGLIKVLFATTSFSIGLNMPTRTVVFTDLYKFNDTSKEILSSSEYLQMCGRAGRRGKDKIGNVYILLTELSNKNEKEDILYMLEGKGTEVASKFRICYKTLLSFYSRNIKDMNEFFRESFLESNLTQKIPEKIKEIEFQKINKKNFEKMNCQFCSKGISNKENNIEKELGNNSNIIIETDININNNNNKPKKKNLTIEDFPIADYYKNLLKYKQLSYDIFTNEKVYDKLNLRPGRILKVRKEPHYNHKRKNKKGKNIDEGIYVILIQAYNRDYFGALWCLVLNKIIKNSTKIKNPMDLATKRGRINKFSFSYEEYTTYDLIEAYEEPFKIKFPKKADNSCWHQDKNYYYYLIDQGILLYSLRELERISKKNNFDEYKEEINFIPLNLKEIDKDLDFQLKVDEREKIANETKNNICINCHNFAEHYKRMKKYKEICDKIEELEGELNPENLEHYKEFKTRQNILQDLEYVNEDNTLTLKGKAAREIGTTDCVLITELLTSDILNSLSDSEIIAFLSGFASNKNEIDTQDPYLGKKFSEQVKKFTNIYEKIYQKEKSYGFEENKYNRRMTFEFSRAMKKWMEGKDFLEVLDETELEEGKLYNLIMRIFLMLEEISNFYSTLGNVGQSKKILEIKEKLMRGIMAMQSLYLQEKIDIDSVGKV
jgi:antiviral helicase SKI2